MFGRSRNRKRREHAASLNWPLIANIMLVGYEIERAKEEQPEVDQATRANGIIFEVLLRIGKEAFTQALIDADFRLKKSDKDIVLNEALATSGYQIERQRIVTDLDFDDLKRASDQRVWDDLKELAATASSDEDREALCRLAVPFLTNIAEQANPNPIEKHWEVIGDLVRRLVTQHEVLHGAAAPTPEQAEVLLIALTARVAHHDRTH